MKQAALSAQDKDTYYKSILLGLDSIASEALSAYHRIQDLKRISKSGYGRVKDVDRNIREILGDVRRNVEWILYDA